MNTDRITFSYAVIYANPRDAILLKSVIALYNMKEKAQWRPTDPLTADLVVLGDGIAQDVAEREILANLKPSQVVLSLGQPIRATSQRMLNVDQPLKAGDVVTRLEQAEAFLRRVSDVNSNGYREATSGETVPYSARVRLIRWPNAALLRKHWDYLRMATILVNHPMSIPELAERSRESEALCSSFLTDVIRSGHGECLDKPEPPVKKSVDSPHGFKSLLQRVRIKLGLLGS